MKKRVLHMILGGMLSAWSVGAAAGSSAFVQRAEVQAFVERVSAAYSLDRAMLEQTLAQVQLKPNIVRIMDRPSTSRPWYQFRPNFVTPALMEGGAAFWQTHAQTLTTLEQQYGVPAEIIVAIVGIETRFGKTQGNIRVLDALATIAFDYPRRAEFFQNELAEFFLLAQEEQRDLLEFKGSYAGAMGIPQFMPSSFRKWAVDFNGDGQRDIWRTPGDALASVAHYLQFHGWERGAAVTIPVEVSAQTDIAALTAARFELAHTVASVQAQGVTPVMTVENEHTPALVFGLEVADGVFEYHLGLQNFYTITRYNRSVHYAMAVYQLSQAIRERFQAQSLPR